MAFWDFTIGDVVGTGLAVGGFGVVWWQARRATTAAEAARAASASAVRAVGVASTIADLGSILGALAAAQEALGSDRLAPAIEHLRLISERLQRMRARPGSWSPDQEATIQDMLAALADIELQLELRVHGRGREPTIPAMLSTLSQFRAELACWDELARFSNVEGAE